MASSTVGPGGGLVGPGGAPIGPSIGPVGSDSVSVGESVNIIKAGADFLEINHTPSNLTAYKTGVRILTP